MSHMLFQTASISPSKSLSLKPSPPIPRLTPPHSILRRRNFLLIKSSSSSPLTDSSSSAAGGVSLERCYASPAHAAHTLPVVTCPEFGPVMKKDYGAFGAVTLEKGKLDTSQKQEQASSPELFDRKFVDAVLNEWKKTMMDLPAGIRQAYEMGLVSSAQMVKFLAINARPTTVRYISRGLPEGISRAFIGRPFGEVNICESTRKKYGGRIQVYVLSSNDLFLHRMIADPAFLYKLLLEQVGTIGCTVWWELKTRKDRIKEEWDLALLNVLTATACNAIVVWSLAPSRSYGNTFQFDLQNTLQKLPNNIFEKSYPLREFDLQKRIHSLFYKAAELSIVGLGAGAVQGTLSNYLGSKKKNRLSVTNPSLSTYALGYGAFLGLYANFRYQMLCGFDKALSNHFDVIGVALFFTTTLRLLNVQLGERSKHAWLGIEADPLAQSENLFKAYNRPVDQPATDSSKWFISKNAIVSGLGLLGLKQGNVNSDEAPAPKARRKRVVRKKVSA
ncbi:hypothetical protein ACFE04_024302 [Oxalis oulophora]